MAIGFGAGAVYLPIIPDLRDFGTKLQAEASKATTAAQTKLKSVGQGLTSAGQALTAAITLPIVGVGAASIKAAVNFESAFAGVRKTVDATEAEFANLERGIRDMAKTIPATREEIAGVAEAAGQLGIKTENILGFSRVMIDLGNATNLSADEAATSLARLANITQMPQDQFDRLGSVVVGLGNNLATTEAEIVEFGQRLAGSGAQIGLTEAEILGFGAALSSVGINAEAGGTAFSKVFMNIGNAVATGGADLDKFAKVAGLSAADFRAAFEQDAAGAIVTFVEGLGKVDAAGGNTFAVLEDLGVTEQRMRDALLRSSGAGDLLRKSIDLGNTAWAENNALTNEASQRYATTESQWNIFKNQLGDTALTLGNALVPALKDLLTSAQPVIDFVTRMADRFAAMDPAAQKVVVVLGLVAAAIGPVLIFAGMIATAIGALLPVFGAIAAGIGAVLGAVGLPVLLVIGVVVALGVVIYKFRDQIMDALRTAWAAVSGFFVRVWEAFTGWLGDVAQWGRDVWASISGAFTGMVRAVRGFFGDVRRVWDAGWAAVMRVVDAVWKPIRTIITVAVKGIQLAIAVYLAAVLLVWETVWGAVSAVVGAVFGFIRDRVIAPVLAWLTTQFNNVLRGIQIIWDATFGALFAKVAEIFAWIRDRVIAPAFAWIDDKVTKALAAIRKTWETVWGAVSSFLAERWENLKRNTQAALDWVRSIIERVTGSIRNTWDRVWGAVTDTARRTWEAIQNGWRGAMDGLRNIIQGAVDTFGRIFDGLRQKFAGPINWVITKLINPFLQRVRDVAAKLNFNLNIRDLAAIPVHHTGGVVGDPRQRREPLFPLKPGEQIIKAKVGERVLTPTEARLYEREGRRTDALMPAKGLGIGGPLSWIKDRATDALQGARELIAKVARPAVEAILAKVGDVAALYGKPGELAGGAARRVGTGVLDWLSGSTADLDAELAKRVPALGKGIGWKAQWDAVRKAIPGAILTSAFRPGSITATGNKSMHAAGRAIDVGGSAALMMRVAQWIRDHYREQTAELIHSPFGGRQLKNGRDTTYTGVTRAMHYDHVHWAMDRGGVLQPGWNLAYNGLGRPEPLARADGGMNVTLVLPNVVSVDQDVPRQVAVALREQLRRLDREYR